MVLIYLQPNLGTALVVLVIGVSMLLVAGCVWRHTVLMGGRGHRGGHAGLAVRPPGLHEGSRPDVH